MESIGLRLLVILLGFSYLISFNVAVPLTRTWSLLKETQEIAASDITHKAINEEALEEEVINGRMDLEIKDYPGIGANNRHTPKPPAEKTN